MLQASVSKQPKEKKAAFATSINWLKTKPELKNTQLEACCPSLKRLSCKRHRWDAGAVLSHPTWQLVSADWPLLLAQISTYLIAFISCYISWTEGKTVSIHQANYFILFFILFYFFFKTEESGLVSLRASPVCGGFGIQLQFGILKNFYMTKSDLDKYPQLPPPSYFQLITSLDAK